MSEPGFTIIDDGAFADFEFEARGRGIEELFVNCARALFTAMTDLETIKPELIIEFTVEGAGLEDLLFAFLSELIFIKDTRKVFLAEFELKLESDNRLYCLSRGEPIDRERHVIKTDVKAATYHKLSIGQVGNLYVTKVILDL